MPNTDALVIGAGHAGLAVSRRLTDAGRDHVVLDRGRVAERWRSERWDSLHLLTPNWLTRLPSWHYTGGDSEGFMAVDEFISYLESYARSFTAPVETGTTVLSVRYVDDGYEVLTDQGTWHTRDVVVATGPWGSPRVPTVVASVAPDLHVTTASQYRNPRSLPEGGVLVVGASASGVQIAEELAVAGRDVVLAVGRHTRLPRRYRGVDICWWLEQTGRLARTIDEVPDPRAARNEPSLQLVGRNNPGAGRDVDLAAMIARGVRVTGRLQRIDERRAFFGGDLEASIEASDRSMHRLLDAVDEYVAAAGLTTEVWAPDRPRPIRVTDPARELDLRAEGINTVLLATGYEPHHPWLHVPVTSADGSIRQYRGITPAPGLYVVGQRFQHRRDSSFIDGARHDAAAVVEHMSARQYLNKTPR